MFIKGMYSGYICDCKDDTFYIGKGTTKHKITGTVFLTTKCQQDHNYDDCNRGRMYDADMRCILLVTKYDEHHFVFDWGQDETIDDLRDIFNKQISEQLEEQYDIGGKKFIEAGIEIEKLLS